MLRDHQYQAVFWVIAAVLLVGGAAVYYNVGYQTEVNDRGSNYSRAKAYTRDQGPRLYQVGQLNGSIQHNNTSLTYNQPLSFDVANMDGVNSAYVMRTDRYAYVAITLDQSGIGTRSAGKETNNDGTNAGVYDSGNPASDLVNPNDVVTGKNGAETVRDHDRLSPVLKQRIAALLRSKDPALQDIFISAHRKFVNTMNNYAQEAWKGHPLTPHVQEFNGIVTQLFGTERLPQK